MQNFIETIQLVFEEEKDEWEELKPYIYQGNYSIIWYASSALDIFPLVLGAGNKLPGYLIQELENPLFIMTDYGGCIDTLKKVYNDLDYGSVNVIQGENRCGFKKYHSFDCNIDGRDWHEDFQVQAFIDQMIPFKIWSDNHRNEHKKLYKTHSYGSPVAEEDWHLVFLYLRIVVNGDTTEYPVIFIGAENLLVFKEIFEKFEIPFDVFFAVRVAGKSGSWDMTHDFSRGELPQAIQKTTPILRPKFWGLEECKWGDDLPQSFVKKGKIPGLGYGGCTIYQTNWR